MPILETPRLVLREFLSDDLGALGTVLSDAETMRFYPAPLDRQGVTDWIERNRRRYGKDGFGLWGMILKSSGELVGDCGLIRQIVEDVEQVEIGYHVHKDLWRRGLATEAAQGCRDYGFNALSLDRLISLIRPENQPSRRVAEKNGMSVCKEVLWRGFPHLMYEVLRTGKTTEP